MKQTVLIALLLGILFTANCKTASIISKTTTNDVIIDGIDDEWTESKVYYEDEKVLLGFQHDSENLYFLMISREPALERQMLQGGFTIWLDDKGKKKKKLGLNIPAMKMDKPVDNRNEMSRKDKKVRRNSYDADFQEKIALQPVFLYLTANKETIPYSIDEIEGFSYARKFSELGIVYEFAIPLNKDAEQLFGYSADQKDIVSLGLECRTPKRERPDREMPDYDEMRDEGSRGGGGRKGQKPEGERSENSSEQAKDYMIWFRVELLQ